MNIRDHICPCGESKSQKSDVDNIDWRVTNTESIGWVLKLSQAHRVT